ncbi:MAG: LysM peptidoglycan-binding domain-containing protein [Actinobacteria bacterium]|nr:LysM peptidoglycan-binding domain-containing protein [Actinomycetota bacterium]
MALAAPFPAAGTRSARTPAPVRLTTRGRVVLLVVSTLFLALVVLLSGRFSADAGTSAGAQGRATGVVVVQPGESLWQIAQQIAPALDPREVVTAIRALNGLGDSTVIAGQSIVVPVLDAAPLAS